MRAERRIRMPVEVTLLWNHAFGCTIGSKLVENVMQAMKTTNTAFCTSCQVAPLERNAQWREYIIERITACVRDWKNMLPVDIAEPADRAFRKRLCLWGTVMGRSVEVPAGTMQTILSQVINHIPEQKFVVPIVKICNQEIGPVAAYQSNYGIDLHFKKLTTLLSAYPNVNRIIEEAWLDCGAIEKAEDIMKTYMQQVGVTASLKMKGTK